jgi:hypothetical protein
MVTSTQYLNIMQQKAIENQVTKKLNKTKARKGKRSNLEMLQLH